MSIFLTNVNACRFKPFLLTIKIRELRPQFGGENRKVAPLCVRVSAWKGLFRILFEVTDPRTYTV